eukprot:1418251-Amphidinium_carterae.1
MSCRALDIDPRLHFSFEPIMPQGTGIVALWGSAQNGHKVPFALKVARHGRVHCVRVPSNNSKSVKV